MIQSRLRVVVTALGPGVRAQCHGPIKPHNSCHISKNTLKWYPELFRLLSIYVYVCIHIHIYIYTYTYAYVHAYIHAYIHTYVHTHIICVHTYTCIYIQICIQPHITSRRRWVLGSGLRLGVYMSSLWGPWKGDYGIPQKRKRIGGGQHVS